MKESVRYWLLTDVVKQQLEKYSIDILEAWGNYWGIYPSASWSVDSIDMVGLESINPTSSVILNTDEDNFLFGLGGVNFKQKVINEFIQKTEGFTDSKLLDSIFIKSIKDFKSKYLGRYQFTGDARDFLSSDKKSFSDFSGNTPATKILISTADVKVSLILSMSLLHTIITADLKQPEQSATGIVFKNPLSSIADEVVTLDVDYGSVDVSVSELSTISVGDVICLDNTISSPLTVRDKKNNPLFVGYLGVNNNMLALKITAEK